ncbi:MAG TPA: Mrp/NBP35 family ATP-binding protein, partial [Acidimicrobiales bacterium]|nr:Mrp/NBP35 family ATP-binding protein [Acidimicrobiales bacterium]
LAAAVAAVQDPRLFHSLGDLGLLRSLNPRRRSTEVTIAVPASVYVGDDGTSGRRELVGRVESAVAAAGAPRAEVSLVELTKGEESELAARLHELGLRGQAPAGPEPGPGHRRGGQHGSEGPTPRPNPFADKASPTRVLMIGSGKGGVGKSSVTVNLAVSLARAGHSVGLLDADVYGFSVPSMLGVTEAPTMFGELLVPPVVHGVRVMSMGFFVPEDKAVIWRGPMLHKALEQFLVDVHWGAPEFLLIDLPPGTGDVSMSIAQFVPKAELFVVTTPQPAAGRVAQRAAVMARELRLPMRGVIENMSWFVGDDAKRYELFGSGGGEQLAGELGVGLLAQLPLVPALRQGGDVGSPIVVTEPESEIATALAELAEKIATMGPSRVYRSELSVR